MTYQDTHDPNLHDTDTDQPYSRCPLCGATIATLCFVAAVVALWYAPMLTLAFAAGCVTALWFSE